MRELAARRWRGQVASRMARELQQRAAELPEIERRALLHALIDHTGQELGRSAPMPEGHT
jgi:hypothetical protein